MMPTYVRDAKRIELEINEKTDTIDLDDPVTWSDDDLGTNDLVSNSSNSDDDKADGIDHKGRSTATASSVIDPSLTTTPTLNATTSRSTKRTFSAVKEESPGLPMAAYKRAKSTSGDTSSWSTRASQSRKNTPGGNLMQSMLAFLDPEARSERQGLQSAHTMLLMQIRSLEQQLQQRESKIDQLHQELQGVRDAKNQAERTIDRLRSELDMTRMMQRMAPPMSYYHPGHYGRRGYYDEEDMYLSSSQGHTHTFPLPHPHRMRPSTPTAHGAQSMSANDSCASSSNVDSSRDLPHNHRSSPEKTFRAGGIQFKINANSSGVTISPSKSHNEDCI